MTYWHDLVTTVLVGTERQRPNLPPAGTSLGEHLAGLDAQSPEKVLLGAAAAASLYQRVGGLPLQDHRELPPPAEPDLAPRCGARAAQHLELMLSGTHTTALPEWLQAAVQRGLRAPEHLLPELLQVGRQDRSLRELILEVAGRRGRWLAAQNREWSYLAIDEDEHETWDTGSRAARQLILSRTRARDPERARTMLAEVWAQEPAEDRGAFLATFRQGLSLDDEAFLEAALDDRSKTVRQVAADLLARVPGSALKARMLQRVQPLVRVFKQSTLLGLGRALQIEVQLPDECTKEMLRDGVEAKLPAPERRFGEKAWWLVQLLAAVPPRVWSEAAQAPAGEVVEAACKSEWRDPLLAAWALAAERNRDPEWAEALVSSAGTRLTSLEPLVELLPPAGREAVALRLLEAGTKAMDAQHPAMQVLQRCRHAWSDRLARAVLERARQRLANQKRHDWTLLSTLPEFGLFISPALAEEAAAGWPDLEPHPHLRERIERLTALLHFRREMLEEIQK